MKSLITLLLVVAMLLVADFAFAQTWTQASAASNVWSSIASSADGSELVAAVYSGPVVSSTNSGATWFTNGAPIGAWQSVASSADGDRLFAVGASGGGFGFYTSTNSGSTWVATSAPFKDGLIACSADGQRLVAASGPIYTSTNSGSTWKVNNLNLPGTSALASSADGNTLIVGRADSSFRVYTSTNAGDTWTTNVLPFYCMGVASSADGTKLAAAVLGFKIYTSTNSGMTWITNTSPNKSWKSVASSADGSKLVGACYNGSAGEIYTSTDSGATWTANTVDSRDWRSVVTSADGNKMTAIAANLAGEKGPIYNAQTTASPQLNIVGSFSNLTLSWIIPSSNFALQQSSDMISWTDVTNTPVLNLTNLQNEVTLPSSNNSSFYRLKTP